MGFIYKNVLRPILFKFQPEQIHNFTISTLKTASTLRLPTKLMAHLLRPPPLPINVMGINFPNPVGLAAGMDKAAEAPMAWEAMGFGFTEIGAVTWHDQPGNPQPRIFRIVQDEAIINRMGFNNPGAQSIANRIISLKSKKLWPTHPVGVNLGKSKKTPLDQAADDYENTLKILLPLCDFFIINVSSPNTPGLRKLQDKSALDEIITRLVNTMSGLHLKKPLLVKVAPDLPLEAIDEIIELVTAKGLDGIVATNTTITRPKNIAPQLQNIYQQDGGLSGRPLAPISTAIIKHIYKQTRGALPIIGVGGIFNANDAWEKIINGSSLIQIYTGLVFEGPFLAKKIVIGLSQKLKAHGLSSIKEAIGLALR
jgi:dihydroorotate dehydrogenase